MKYRFYESDISIAYIETITGVKVANLVKGNIETGEFEERINRDGELVKLPLYCRGIEVELEGEPTLEQLRKMDRTFVGLKREGGIDLASEIDQIKSKIADYDTLKARIENLEKK